MTKFKDTPLFGPDSNPQNTSSKLGIIGTAIFWLLVLIFLAVAKPLESKPKYKEVQIVLSSTLSVKKAEEAPAPAAAAPAPAESSSPVETPVPVVETPAPVVETKKAEPSKPVETPKTKTEPVKKTETPKKAAAKTEPKKTETKPAATKQTAPAAKQSTVVEPVETPIYKSVEELMAEQMSAKRTKSADYDPWASFDEEATTSQSIDSTPKTVTNNTPAFEGSAGQAASSQSQAVTSEATSAKKTVQTTSTGTTTGLSNIKSASKVETSFNSDIMGETPTASSGTFKWNSGSSRRLLSKANITLSEAAESTIDTSLHVNIKITITEAGYVSKVELPSYLSNQVKIDVERSIKEWQFSTDSSIAIAEFEWIVKHK